MDGVQHQGSISQCDGEIDVYCPECSPGGTIVHRGEQLKKFLPFGLQRDLMTLNATDT